MPFLTIFAPGTVVPQDPPSSYSSKGKVAKQYRPTPVRMLHGCGSPCISAVLHCTRPARRYLGLLGLGFRPGHTLPLLVPWLLGPTRMHTNTHTHTHTHTHTVQLFMQRSN